jgi:hypothetical protein
VNKKWQEIFFEQKVYSKFNQQIKQNKGLWYYCVSIGFSESLGEGVNPISRTVFHSKNIKLNATNTCLISNQTK